MRSIHFALCALMAAGVCALRAQTQPPAPAATTIGIKTLRALNPNGTAYLDVIFDSILDTKHSEDLSHSNVTILAKPSGASLPPDSIAYKSNILVEITLLTPPTGNDDSVNVCFKELHFFSKGDDTTTHTSSPDKPVCSTSKMMTKAETKALVDQLVTAAVDKAKADKTSSEKNIFASGFVTTAGQSNSQGGADISLNGSLSGLPGTTTFLQIQKTTLNNGDPRHFEAGFSWRNTSSFQRTVDAEIKDLVDKYNQGGTQAQLQELGNEINAAGAKYGVWLGALEDIALKMEGDPTQFKAANVVGDGDIRILTRTLKLFGSTNGYFRARPLVVGFEGGKSITGDTTTTATTPTTTPSVDWIARGKVGADFTLFYDNPKTAGPIKRVEINAGGVERYLFLKEINYDTATNQDSTTGKGSRPYFQSDVKLFFYEDAKNGRLGLRMAYTRGSLPPVFANVKSFQFGLVYETADDKAKTANSPDKTKTAANAAQ